MSKPNKIAKFDNDKLEVDAGCDQIAKVAFASSVPPGSLSDELPYVSDSCAPFSTASDEPPVASPGPLKDGPIPHQISGFEHLNPQHLDPQAATAETSEKAENLYLDSVDQPLPEEVCLPEEVYKAEAQVLSDSCEVESAILSALVEEEEKNAFLSYFLNEEDKECEVEDDHTPFDYDSLEKDPPLYDGAPITLHQSLVSILTLVLTFQLSGVCLKSLLDLIQLHLPQLGNKFKTSLQFFKDYFFYLQSPKQFQYYCSQCFRQFSKGSSCPKKCKDSKTCFLIKIPLLDQIKTLFAREGFFSKLNFVNAHTPGKFTDIYDGGVYQDQVKSGKLGKSFCLSLQWYTDGVALYKSTNFSVWMTYLTINELPYSQRFKKENVIVPVIWCGPTKPPGNLILNAMQPELQELSEGIKFDVHGSDPKVVKVIVLNGTADLPAKAMMLDMKESNGANSCQKCDDIGESRVNYPGVRLFPYKPEMTLRTHEKFKKCAEDAHDTGKIVSGVKGFSTLLMIVPDIIRGTAIDPMHLLSGITKKILSSLLDTSVISKKWSIAAYLETLDQRLVSIKPPAHIMRGPRSLKELAYWKMSEIIHFLTEYAVPVLQQILPRRYFLHFCSLVAAIQLLGSDTVTEEDIVKAKDLLRVFVSQLADFYSVNVLTMNFHLLLHLGDAVRDLGPLWVYSCFPLENLNGIVLNLVHGTRWADRQIATSVQTCLGLPKIVQEMPDSSAKNFSQRLLNRGKFFNSQIVDNCIVIGKTKIVPSIPQNVQVLMKEKNVMPTKVYEVKSLKKGKFIYGSQKNNVSVRHDSTVAAYQDQDTLNVGEIQEFLQVFSCDCSNHCSCETHIYVIVKTAKRTASFPTLISGIEVPNTHEYEIANEAKLFPCTHLVGTCIRMVINNKCFISLPLNSRERE